MLSLQQAATVKVAMRPVQQSLFDPEATPAERDPSAQPAPTGV